MNNGPEDIDNLPLTLEQVLHGKDPLPKAKSDQKSAVQEFCNLHRATQQRDIAEMARIIRSKPHMIHQRDKYGKTPLFKAVNSYEATELLLESRADPYAISLSQNNIMDFAKENNKNTPFSNWLNKKIGLSDEALNHYRKSFHAILQKEMQTARNQQKIILFMLGERHGHYHQHQLEKLIITVAQKLGIQLLLNEVVAPTQSVQHYAKKHGFSLGGVDQQHDRLTTSLAVRNGVMAKNISQIKQDALFIVGSNHFQGLLNNPLTAIDFSKFYVIPFDLSSFNRPLKDENDGGFLAEFFLENPQNVIHVTKDGFSDHRIVIDRWNGSDPLVHAKVLPSASPKKTARSIKKSVEIREKSKKRITKSLS